MPRYIDADALYKETEKKIKANNEYGRAVVDGEFLDLINDAFIEDVVPREEADRLRSILDAYALQYGTVKDQQAVIERIKAETAREIFEEISKASADWGCFYISEGKLGYVTSDVSRTLTELKEKYTEEYHEIR